MDFVSSKSIGCGIGLRPKHYPQILSEWPKVDWLEAISENFMDSGGRPLRVLEQVRSRYPVALHGVALSIGSVDPLDQSYLKNLKQLVRQIDPFLVSDHLCWSGAEGSPLHDLLPLPFNEESLNHIVRRVNQAQEFLARPILLENVSSYVTYRHSDIPEWEFISEIAKRSGCGILLDVNNVYVNAVNHKFDPSEYIRHIPTQCIGQIHLAGHANMGEFLFDTHGSPVIDPVWNLYEEALITHGQISTLIEWDENIPSFERLQEEASLARKIYDRCGVTAKDAVIARTSKTRTKPMAPQAPGLDKIQLTVPSVAHNDDFLVSLFEVESKIKERILPNHSQMTKRQSFTFLNPQGSASGAERMEVYVNGYPARMYEALKETYETIYRVLGHDTFSDLCHVYIQKYPSHHYNLNYVGQHLPEFLNVLPEHIAARFPFLSDLAALEWKCWQAFHAFDQKSFEPRELAQIPMEEWEKAKLTFQPSVALVITEWPVLDLWKTKHAEEFKFDLNNMRNQSQRILVGRYADIVRCELLNTHQCQLIGNLMAGAALGVACEQLAQENSDLKNLPLANWFATWVQVGLIASCSITESV